MNISAEMVLIKSVCRDERTKVIAKEGLSMNALRA